jgi:hypothetical protein
MPGTKGRFPREPRGSAWVLRRPAERLPTCGVPEGGESCSLAEKRADQGVASIRLWLRIGVHNEGCEGCQESLPYEVPAFLDARSVTIPSGRRRTSRKNAKTPRGHPCRERKGDSAANPAAPRGSSDGFAAWRADPIRIGPSQDCGTSRETSSGAASVAPTSTTTRRVPAVRWLNSSSWRPAGRGWLKRHRPS